MSIPHYQEIADVEREFRRETTPDQLARIAPPFIELEPPEPPHIIRAQQRENRLFAAVCVFGLVFFAWIAANAYEKANADLLEFHRLRAMEQEQSQ